MKRKDGAPSPRASLRGRRPGRSPARAPLPRAYDAIVIGAGPAGLSAAAALARFGSCLFLDQGESARRRDRNDPDQLLHGSGGAGLFSDGKHSFFPASSALWSLPDREALSAAFAETAALLRGHGVDAGAFPDAPPVPVAEGVWHEKLYPSHYVPFETRLAIIEELRAEAAAPDRRGNHALLGARVLDAERQRQRIGLLVDGFEGRRAEVQARRIVIATGRLSPHWVRPWMEKLGVRFAFGRVEIGVRLEGRSSSSLFDRLPGVDGKLRFVEPAEPVEVRTFCTCRNGEVVLGYAGGIRAWSGRADVPPTGRSNVGLVVRVTDERLGREIADGLATIAPFQCTLDEWITGGAARFEPAFGATAARLLWRALGRLLEWAPGMRGERFTVYAPCIEGVGDYPVDDGSLRVAPGVWVAGDLCGRFRGIVAGMVSGRYAARRLMRDAARGESVPSP